MNCCISSDERVNTRPLYSSSSAADAAVFTAAFDHLFTAAVKHRHTLAAPLCRHHLLRSMFISQFHQKVTILTITCSYFDSLFVYNVCESTIECQVGREAVASKRVAEFELRRI